MLRKSEKEVRTKSRDSTATVNNETKYKEYFHDSFSRLKTTLQANVPSKRK